VHFIVLLITFGNKKYRSQTGLYEHFIMIAIFNCLTTAEMPVNVLLYANVIRKLHA